MKFLFALLVCLLAVAATNADSFGNDDHCGPNQCLVGHTCVCDNGNFRCLYFCGDVTITQKVVSRWADNNGQTPYTQVEVTIKNTGNKSVKNVVLGNNMQLKDNQLWSMTRLSNGNLILPSYVTKLTPGQTHTFGYINKGNSPATIYVKYVDLF